MAATTNPRFSQSTIDAATAMVASELDSQDTFMRLSAIGAENLDSQQKTTLLALEKSLGYKIGNKIPTTLEMLPIGMISKIKNNPRNASSFLKNNYKLAKLRHSFEDMGGWCKAWPAVVHIAPGSNIAELLSGHRRLAVAMELGITEVPCLVFRGLTKNQKLRIVMDHELAEGLTNAERYESFRILQENGFDKFDIMDILGLYTKRSQGTERDDFAWRKLERLHNIPAETRTATLAYQDGIAKSNLPDGVEPLPFNPTVKAIELLDDACKADESEGWIGEKSEGPNYLAAVESLVRPENDGPKSGPFKPEKLITIAKGESRIALARLLRRIGGGTNEDLSPLLDIVRYALDFTFGRPKGATEIDRADILVTLGTAPTAESTDSAPTAESADSAPTAESTSVADSAPSATGKGRKKVTQVTRRK